jgi:hypothetical protein
VILGNWDSCEPLNSGSRCIRGRLGTWTSSGLLESGSFGVQMSMPGGTWQVKMHVKN